MTVCAQVIFVSGDFFPMPSGIGDYTRHLAGALAQQGLTVSVMTTDMGTASTVTESSGVEVYRIMRSWQFKERTALLCPIARQGAGTVVNVQYHCPATYGRKLMINFLPLMIRRANPRVRIITTIHGFSEQSFMYRLRLLPMLRYNHGIIYVDRRNAKPLTLYSGLGPERMRFIPIASNIIPATNGVNVRRDMRRTLDVSETDPVVAYFGAIGPGKGFECLLDAIGRVRRSDGLAARLVAIGGFHSFPSGNPCEREIRRKMENPDVRTWLRVVQEPDSPTVSKYLYAADVAVFPFVNGVGENSGSLLAAIAHGLPTVITRGRMSTEDFIHQVGVVCAAPRDCMDLAAKISWLLRDYTMQTRLRRRNLEFSRTRTWEGVAHAVAAFCEEILAMP